MPYIFGNTGQAAVSPNYLFQQGKVGDMVAAHSIPAFKNLSAAVMQLHQVVPQTHFAQSFTPFMPQPHARNCELAGCPGVSEGTIANPGFGYNAFTPRIKGSGETSPPTKSQKMSEQTVPWLDGAANPDRRG